MTYETIVARLLDAALRLSAPTLRTVVLREEHAEAAAVLLAREFCRREPLCRLLKLKEVDLLPFFTKQVEHVARGQLGIAAIGRDRQLKGVVIIEDYLDLFQPQDMALPEGLQAIGQCLDLTDIPEKDRPQAKGELYHCALAAVASGGNKSRTLSLMIMATYRHLKRLGYRRGYAKVTNAAVVKKFRKIEKLARRTVFQLVATSQPANFLYKGSAPFASYDGVTSLIMWRMP